MSAGESGGAGAGAPDPSYVLIDGPWQHRMVAANGARFHVVEAGSGPPVVLLHGFPLFWWTWRHALPALADAGYRALAMDLRGYGASDKPPRGYDPFTLAADVAGVIRSLGEADATIVGQGVGGEIAWAMTELTPAVVRAAVVVCAPHPRALRAAAVGDPRQLRLLGPTLGYQVPRLPERRLTNHDGAAVAALLHRWSARPWPDGDPAVTRFATAFCIPAVAHSAMEMARWGARSMLRPDGLRFAGRMRRPTRVPMLHIHGAADPIILPRTAAVSAAFVQGTHTVTSLPGVGHFPQEEDPDSVVTALLDWLPPA